MRTSKSVAILLTVVLTGILAAGQDQPPASSPAGQRARSNTRSASCILRITVDPAILPLNGETVDSLLHSPAVLLKAAHDVLSFNNPADLDRLNQPQDSGRSLIMVRWLNMAAAPGPRPPQPGLAAGYDKEMMRQLEDVYGRDYAMQMMGVPNQEKKGETKEGDASSSPQNYGRPGPGRQGSPGAPGTGAMGSYGGMAVGGMGGTGGMGMGGGMMGGYGGMSGMASGYGGMGGMGFSYGAPGAPQQDAGATRSATVELQVNLPNTVPPMADEFLKGLVRNLQDTLSRAHESYVRELESMLVGAKAQHQNVESESAGRAGDVAEVRRRLEMFVDTSALTSQMPLERAVDVLRRSVDPPLNITVLWRDMQTNAEAEASSPINIEGSPKMRLATALDLLVKGFDAGVGTARPTWRIKDDTVVIGTTATQGRPQEGAGQPYAENDARNLAGERSELTRRVQALELDLAGLEARWHRIVSEIPDVKKRVAEKLSQDAALQELEKLTKLYTDASSMAPDGRVISPDSAEGRQNLIRARIELANRREELSKQAGGGQLDEFNKELTRIVIDQAEKRAQLKMVREQLDQVQKQLAQALTFDPEAARLRLAQEALDIAARRVTELQMRLANLQPPLVTVIGAN